jgi:hypothetical protein
MADSESTPPSIPMLYRETVGFVARCSRCLTFSGTELASSQQKAWKALPSQGWSEEVGLPICPECAKKGSPETQGEDEATIRRKPLR